MKTHLLMSAVLLLAACQSKKAPGTTDGGVPDASNTSSDVEVSGDVATADVSSTADVASGDVAADLPDPPTDVPLNEAVFAATHNSYSGESRGAIRAQLDAGIRFIELDVHADDFATEGYRVGHDAPGHEVDFADPNPDTASFLRWLDTIAGWHQDHPDHTPLTLGIDVKDPISTYPTDDDGNLGRLNRVIRETFGDTLLTEADVANGWPTVDEARGRVLVVLSGDTPTRLAYRRTPGREAAVAANTEAIVVAHENAVGVTVWSGSRERFVAYERIDGIDPAVAINADGSLVLLTVVGGQLQVRTGTASASGIAWAGEASDFPEPQAAANPSVRFTDSTTLRVIFEDASGELKYWDGVWDPATDPPQWTASTGSEPRFDEASEGAVTAVSTATPPYGDIVHLEEDGTRRRVVLGQAMFSEVQYSGPEDFVDDDVLVYAADAFNPSAVAWAEDRQREGFLVRLWKFNLPNVRPEPPVTFPATDRPYSSFYAEYCREAGCTAGE